MKWIFQPTIRKLSRENLKCDGTERVDVGAGSRLSIFFICDKINQFRRSPADRSWVVGIEWQVIALGKYRRQSKICYVCVSSAVNQYVVSREVPMSDMFAVKVLNSCCDLFKKYESVSVRELGEFVR